MISRRQRKEANLYPFCKVCLLRLSGENYELTEFTAIKLAKYFKNLLEEKKWKVVGPAPSLIAKIGKRFRWQILLHGPENSSMPLPERALIWKLVPKKVILSIDVNPVEL